MREDEKKKTAKAVGDVENTAVEENVEEKDENLKVDTAESKAKKTHTKQREKEKADAENGAVAADEDQKTDKAKGKPKKLQTKPDEDESVKASADNKKKNNEDDEKSKSAVEMFEDKNSDKRPVRTKPNRIYYSLSLMVIAAAVIVYLVFGFAPSVQNIGARVYVATLPTVVEEEKVPALIEDIVAITGSNANVSVKESMTTVSSYVEIAVQPGEELSKADEEKIVTMLNSSYIESSSEEDVGVESLISHDITPALSIKNVVTLLIVFAMIVLVVLILASIFIDGKSALYIMAMLLHDALIVGSLYIICRVPSPRILIAAVLVVCIASPYFNITKIAALKTSLIGLKKRRKMDAVNEVSVQDAIRNVDSLVIGAMICVAFAAVGIAFSVVTIAYVGIIIFAAYAVAIYSSTLFMPNLWAAEKKKR